MAGSMSGRPTPRPAPAAPQVLPRLIKLVQGFSSDLIVYNTGCAPRALCMLCMLRHGGLSLQALPRVVPPMHRTRTHAGAQPPPWPAHHALPPSSPPAQAALRRV